MKRLGLAVKWALSIGLLGWIFSRLDLVQLGPRLADAHWEWLGAGFLCGGLAIAGMAWRWQACLAALELDLPLAVVTRITLSAWAMGYFSVGQLGVDATKILLAGQRLGGRHGALAASLSLDHASSIPSLLVLFGFTVVPHGLVPVLREHGWEMLLYSVLGFVAVGLIVRWKWAALHARIFRVLTGRRMWQGFAVASGRSMFLWFAFSGVFYCAARAFAVEVPFASFAGVTVIADTVAALPISVAGLGVREQVFQSLLQSWHGVPAAAAVALSLAGFALLLMWAMIGGLLMMKDSVSPPNL